MQKSLEVYTRQSKIAWGSFLRDWRYLWRSLFFIAGLIAIVAGTGFAVKTYNQAAKDNRNSIEEYQTVAPYFANHLQLYDFAAMTSLSVSLLDHREVLSVLLTDKNGTQLFYSTKTPEGAMDVKKFKARLEADDATNSVLGYLLINYAVKSQKQIFKEAIKVALAAYIFTFFASCALISFFIRRYVMSPVHELTNAIEKTLITGEPVKAAFGVSSPFENFVNNFNHMQERLVNVQKGLGKSLEEVRRERKRNAELFAVLQNVLTATGQNVSYFSADGDVHAHDIGKPGGSIFKDIKSPYPITSDGLKAALSARLDGKGSGKVKILNTPHNDNILYEIEVDNSPKAVKSVKCIDLGNDRCAVITTDITASREIEKSLRQKHKLEALGALTSGVAHDFNNLLSVISAAMEILLGERRYSDKQKRLLDQVAYATERATSVVNGLLVYSHQKPLTFAPVRMGGLLDRLAEILPATLGPAISIKKSVNSDGYVSVDESLLENAILNLVVNARDAMEGTGTLGLNITEASQDLIDELKLDATKGYCIVEVTDTGPGINEEFAHRIVDPFFTSKDIGKGTGLGLSTVVGFAGQMGGKLHFGNRPEGGAKFSIILPKIEAPEEVKEEVANAPSVQKGDMPKRILIVDDEAVLCELWSMAARNAGMYVDTAICVHDAVKLYFAENNPGYDVVVTDLNMPDGTGLDLARKIRSKDADMVIVATSGNADLLTSQFVHGDNFDGIYNKPIKLGKLVEVISMHWLDKRGAPKELEPAIHG